MIVDFTTVKFEEIIGKLKTYEERIKFRKESQEDNIEKLLFTRQENDRNYEHNYGNGRRGGGNQTRGRGRGRFARDSKTEDSYDRRRKNHGDQNYHRRDIREIECYNCHKFGHYAADCPKPDHRREISNLVFEDDEPTLLMAMSKDENEMASLEEEPRWNEIVIEKDEIPKEKLEGMRSKIETDLKSKLEFWKLEILQDIEMEKQEFEKKMRDREIAFEKQMQRRLENLTNSRDCTSIEMKESHEVVLDKKQLKDERSTDNGKRKKHSETPSRSPKGSQVEKDIKSSNKKVEPEDHDTSTTNRLLEIQDYEMILPTEDGDNADKDDRDEIKDKEKRSQIKEKVRDIVRVNGKDNGSGNKPKFRKQDLIQHAQDKDDGA